MRQLRTVASPKPRQIAFDGLPLAHGVDGRDKPGHDALVASNRSTGHCTEFGYESKGHAGGEGRLAPIARGGASFRAVTARTPR